MLTQSVTAWQKYKDAKKAVTMGLCKARNCISILWECRETFRTHIGNLLVMGIGPEWAAAPDPIAITEYNF